MYWRGIVTSNGLRQGLLNSANQMSNPDLNILNLFNPWVFDSQPIPDHSSTLSTICHEIRLCI